MEISYSIIIPHKNTPDLLIRCLDSIPYREDIEIIVVDDNSNSEIVNFDKFPGYQNLNVSIILTKEGYGAGYARNIGLSKARGKWLFFADADDFFNQCFLEAADSKKDSDADIVFFSMNSVYSDTLLPANRGEYYSKMVTNFCHHKINSEDVLRYESSASWAKMVRHDLVKKFDIFFDEVIASNDAMFSKKTGHYAKSIAADQSVIYCATVSLGSLTNRRSFDILYSRYLVALRTNIFLESIHKEKYRRSIMLYLLTSLRYGILQFFDMLVLAFKYKANIFVGISNWTHTLLNMRMLYLKKKGYTIRE